MYISRMDGEREIERGCILGRMDVEREDQRGVY